MSRCSGRRVVALVMLLLSALFAALLLYPPACIRLCTATGYSETTPACFVSGKTHLVALWTIYPRGECYYKCGQAVRYMGTCQCPGGCGIDVGKGFCAGSSCICNDGWGGPDCSNIRCPNPCSGQGVCITSNGTFSDRCECSPGWTAPDCMPWNATPSGDLGLKQYFTDDGGDYHPLWNMSEIATIKVRESFPCFFSCAKLTVDPDDFDETIDARRAYQNDYIEAGFEFHNSYIHETASKVGIKTRGAFSRRVLQKSWSVSFTKFVKGRRVFGQKKINLKTATEDMAQVKNHLGIMCYRYDVSLKFIPNRCSSMNVPVYRSSFAILWINGICYGLYNIVEDTNDDFLQSRFGESKGNFFKAGMEHSTLLYENENPHYYETVGCKYVNDDAEDNAVASTCLYEQAHGNGNWSDFVHMLKTVTLAKGKDRLQQIDKVISLDLWTRATAVEMAIAHSDGYAANGNNWFLYHARDDRSYIVPSDFSNEFNLRKIFNPIVPFDRSAPSDYSHYGPWNKIFYMQPDSGELLESYLNHVQDFASRVFSSPALYEQLVALHRFLYSVVLLDPFLRGSGGLSRYNEAYNELLQVISNRSTLLLDQTEPLKRTFAAPRSFSSIIIWLVLPSLACIVAISLSVGNIAYIRGMRDARVLQRVVTRSLLDDPPLFTSLSSENQV